MSKVAVVYWSSTGNTEAMANAVVDGAKEKGADVTLYECADFRPELVADYDAIAFGCPAMGDEVLEEDEFEPMFDGCKAELKDKKIALFGSYGWGDGEWMRNWEDTCKGDGANLVCEVLSVTMLPMTTPLRLAKSLAHHLLNLGCKYSIS